jgi:hypothetical protein
MTAEHAKHVLLNKISVYVNIKEDEFDDSLKTLPGFLYIPRDDDKYIMLFNPDTIHNIQNYFRYVLDQSFMNEECYGVIFIDDAIRSIAIVSDTELSRIRKVLEENSRYDILMKIS